MKVWAHASAIGLSLAYFAGCSSEPPTDNTYVPPPGGGGTAAGGSGTGTSGTGTAGSSTTAGTGMTAGTGTGGDMGTAGSGTAGSSGSGGGGGVPPAGECPAGVDGHCKAGFEYPKYEGFTLKLVEEFDAPLDLNNDPIWTWSDGSPESGQTGFREQNIGFAEGHMTLTAESPCAPKTTNSGCVDPRKSFGEAQAPGTEANVARMGVWSGELRTKYNNYRYGRYEVRYAAPLANPNGRTTNSSSGFLSTMFVFRTPKNVIWNEIDIELEPKGFDKIFGNAVNFMGPGNTPVGYPNDPARNEAWEETGPAGYNMYDPHDYAFNWTPGKIEWFVDGMLIKTFTGEAANQVSSASAKIMMNLWIFSGNAFGDSGGNVYPFTAKYDWFRFYKYNEEMTYPCSPTPGCLPAADKTTSSQNNPKEVNYGM